MPKEKRTSRRDREERDGGRWTPTGDVQALPTVEPDPEEEVVKKTDTSCMECGAVVSTKSLKRHIREQHSLDLFECHYCSFTTKRAGTLEQHERAQHEALFRRAEDAEEDEAPAATQEPVVRGGADSAVASTSWVRGPTATATSSVTADRKAEAPTNKPTTTGEAPLMPRALVPAATCALPPAMGGERVVAKSSRSHVNVHGLRDFAPPQGYAWAFHRPAELTSLVQVSEYVAELETELARFTRYERQFGDIRHSIQKSLTESGRDVLQLTVNEVGDDLRSVAALRLERDAAQQQLAAVTQENAGLRSRMAAKKRRTQSSRAAVERLAREVAEELRTEGSGSDTDVQTAP